MDSAWILQQLSDGVGDDEVVQRAKDHMQADVEHRLSRTVAAMTASTTRHLRATRPAIMRGVRRSRRQFEARLEPLWGDGFENLDALVHVCQELSLGHLSAHAQQREDDNDFRTSTSRSIRTASPTCRKPLTRTSRPHASLRSTGSAGTCWRSARRASTGVVQRASYRSRGSGWTHVAIRWISDDDPGVRAQR